MFSLYKSSKVFVCLYVRVTLITRPIWFSFAMMLLVGQGKILNYFGRGYITPQIDPPSFP